MQMPRSTEFKSTDLKSRHTGWLSSTCKGKKTKCNLHGRWWFLHNSLNFLIWITFQNLPALRSTPQVEILRSGGWETTNWKQPRLNNWQLWFKGKKSSSFLKQRSMYLPGNYSANHWQLHIIQSYPKPAFSTEVQLAGFVRKVYTVTRFEAFPKISCLVLFYLPQKVRRYFPQLHDSAPPPEITLAKFERWPGMGPLVSQHWLILVLPQADVLLIGFLTVVALLLWRNSVLLNGDKREGFLF